jgi:hypothetical protein
MRNPVIMREDVHVQSRRQGEQAMTSDSSVNDEIRGWFAGSIPADWFTGTPLVSIDREEILVIGDLPEPELAKDAGDGERAAARTARIAAFREETRAARMRLAGEAEHRFRRKVSWGASCGGERMHYTTLGLPVMTRLRQPERVVLDTLVDAGVARSRSEALAWCVKLVVEHQREWIDELRHAMKAVEQVRTKSPLQTD